MTTTTDVGHGLVKVNGKGWLGDVANRNADIALEMSAILGQTLAERDALADERNVLKAELARLQQGSFRETWGRARPPCPVAQDFMSCFMCDPYAGMQASVLGAFAAMSSQYAEFGTSQDLAMLSGMLGSSPSMSFPFVATNFQEVMAFSLAQQIASQYSLSWQGNTQYGFVRSY